MQVTVIISTAIRIDMISGMIRCSIDFVDLKMRIIGVDTTGATMSIVIDEYH